MTSINLYQDSSQQGEKKEGIMSGGLFVSLSIFVVALVVLGALKIYSSLVARQNTAIEAQIQSEKSAISGDRELNTVTDFQKRMDTISADLGSKEYVKTVLQNVSADMVAPAVLTNFSYDSGKVLLTMSADGFQTVAKQILNFKKSDHFSGAAVSSIGRTDKGISFSIEMATKQ